MRGVYTAVIHTALQIHKHTHTHEQQLCVTLLEPQASRSPCDKAESESEGMRGCASKPAWLIVIIAYGCMEMRNVTHQSEQSCTIMLSLSLSLSPTLFVWRCACVGATINRKCGITQLLFTVHTEHVHALTLKGLFL